MHFLLLKALQRMQEEQFTEDVVIPFVKAVHPGLVEYVHSALEAGRDILSIGRDEIGREDVLCVQVKVTAVSFAAGEFQKLVDTARAAKEIEVSSPNGRKSPVGRVWVVNSQPFPEHKRRQVLEMIEGIERTNIKFIAGDELCSMLIERTPGLAASILKARTPDAMNVTRLLAMHHEAAAFGLPSDHVALTDFYVPATVAPGAVEAYRALEGQIKVYSVSSTATRAYLYTGKKAATLLDEPHGTIRRHLEELEISALQKKTNPFQIRHKARVVSSMSDFIREAKAVLAGGAQEPDASVVSEEGEGIGPGRRAWIAGRPGHQTNRGIGAELSKYTVEIESDPVACFRTHLSRTTKAVAACPRRLGANTAAFLTAHSELAQLQGLFCCLDSLWGDQAVDVARLEDGQSVEPLRVEIDDPVMLVRLGSLVVLDGPPGCGKTTLMKIMAIRLIEDETDVTYVPCHRVQAPLPKRMTLRGIADKHGLRATLRPRRKKAKGTVLLLDGLDESAVDFRPLVEKGKGDFETIVVACRSQFRTELRENALTLSVTSFSAEARNQFFERWFCNDPITLGKAYDLIKRYPDIDEHTRLPLVATLTAVLVGQGYEPKTRADIYGQRLDLLLERWDRARGVRRVAVKDIGPKRRFLRQLAFGLHTARARSFNREAFLATYDRALGELGYKQITVDGLFNDLTVASGILVEEEGGYSLGHLSFQEHLVGEYLSATNVTARSIAGMLGDDWWREALLFYASIREDITDLVTYLYGLAQFNHVEQVLAMARVAPYTSAGIVDSLQEWVNAANEEDRGHERWERLSFP